MVVPLLDQKWGLVVARMVSCETELEFGVLIVWFVANLKMEM
jgi:hypothetical protein